LRVFTGGTPVPHRQTARLLDDARFATLSLLGCKDTGEGRGEDVVVTHDSGVLIQEPSTSKQARRRRADRPGRYRSRCRDCNRWIVKRLASV